MPIHCCFGCSVVSAAAVRPVAVYSLPNRLNALAGVVLLTALSLFTAGVELIELSDFIIKSGLRVDTLDSGASVNSVDLDAVGLFVFIGKCVLCETLSYMRLLYEPFLAALGITQTFGLVLPSLAQEVVEVDVT